MPSHESAKTIDSEAAFWAARIDRGLSGEEEAALEAWLAGNTRRLGALARARAIWVHAENAVALDPLIAAPVEAPAPATTGLTRRRLLAASLVAGLMGAAGGWHWWHAPLKVASGVGEIRRVPLGDGSVATLDTDSIIEVAFTATERRLRLTRGGAYFEAVADAARPFVVETAGLMLRSKGAAFAVRAVTGLPVNVLVSSGEVALTALAAPGGLKDKLEAGMRVTLAPGQAALLSRQALSPEDVDRSLAWRGGMLAFEGETLGEAATMFARYGGPTIMVDDAALAREPITGLFAASDPAGFARAIALGLGVRAHQQGDVIHLAAH